MTSGIPTTLVAGDSWAWITKISVPPEVPSPWTLKYVLRPIVGGNAVEVDSIADLGGFHFSMTATDSAAIAPGKYEWVLFAFGPQDFRARLDCGRLELLPDPAAAGGDLRSRVERTLDAINATLEGRATKDADAFTIEGRSISRTPIPDLLKLQAYYERKLYAERNPGASFISYRRVSI
ncbi:MAG: hypothetical protein ABJL72_12210 [Roseobacter sp.]